jgi:hypothetical protein
VDFHHILLAGLPAHSHTVAVQDGCTNIPLAAGRARAGETILRIGVQAMAHLGSSTRIRQN